MNPQFKFDLFNSFRNNSINKALMFNDKQLVYS